MRSTEALHFSQTVHQLAYDHLLKYVHPPGAAQERIDTCFRNRWLSAMEWHTHRLIAINCHWLPFMSCEWRINGQVLAINGPRIASNVQLIAVIWHLMAYFIGI